MTPLRLRMIRELELQRKSPLTVKSYVKAVAQLAQHYGRSPDAISVEEVRDFLHYLITQKKVAFSTCNQKLAAIKFFYRHVLGQKELSLRVPSKRSGRLPEPLSREEIAKILEATRNLKHRALLMTAYGGGLRVSELVRLQPADIHSQRMLIRVNQGKGRKDRYTLLSQRLLEELRTYWRAYRPQVWLFPSRDTSRPLPANTAKKIFTAIKQRVGIQHGHGIHSLRHSFATHLMESGVREWCAACGFERYQYHSCRNRHCPKCQNTATAAWVAARQEELLPVPYFHQVFTLPHELNPLILCSERNQRALLRLLFEATAQTLLEFGRRELGGKIGFTLVLHTWDQRLQPHFHLHGLVASGALADDGSRWIAGGRKFLFPVCGLSKMFRAKYLDGLAALLETEQLDVPPQLAELAEATTRRRWLRRWRKKPWVVYSQAPFAGPRKLLDYLGRYTHRVAIGNHRILSCEAGQVHYRYRDRRDGDRLKTDLLPAEEFLRRFLRHVLPDRFSRVRHYGLLANRGKRERLARCRELLGARPPRADEQPATAAEWMHIVLGIDITCCPGCGGQLQRESLPQPLGSPAAACLPPSFRRVPLSDSS